MHAHPVMIEKPCYKWRHGGYSAPISKTREHMYYAPESNNSLVWSSDPTVKEGKGLVYNMHFLGGTGCSMSCDWHDNASSMIHQLLSTQAIDGYSYEMMILFVDNSSLFSCYRSNWELSTFTIDGCSVVSRQSHVNHMACIWCDRILKQAPECAWCIVDPFLPWGRRLGMRDYNSHTHSIVNKQCKRKALNNPPWASQSTGRILGSILFQCRQYIPVDSACAPVAYPVHMGMCSSIINNEPIIYNTHPYC